MDRARAIVRPLSRAADVRGTRDIGRRARLELRFAVRNGRTTLVDAYAEPPLRVGRAFPEGDGLHLILTSSAPGIFGGDLFEQFIVVERGARVRLTSQSSLQAHPSTEGARAALQSRYDVESDATLLCEWHPMIPFPGARLDQQIHLEVDDGGRLLWSDAFMNGREARGERWQFAELSHELSLRQGGQLAHVERYRIEPQADEITRAWIAADGAYFGTILAGGSDRAAADAESLHSCLSDVSGVTAAADAIDEALVLVRLMSASGVAFHAARAAAFRQLSQR